MSASLDLNLEDSFPDDDAEEIYYFYDDEEHYHRLREERGDMPNIDHNNLVDYLLQVLRWLYRLENYAIHREVNFYQTADPQEKPFYPDVFVLKSAIPEHLTSYRLGDGNPSPAVIIEVLSTKTRKVDLEAKPRLYARWGVKEYFVYDPRPRLRKTKMRRLWGWQTQAGQVFEMPLEQAGTLWSTELSSRLVPDNNFLRFYDSKGNLRLTEAQALSQTAQAERQQRLETERQTQDLLKEIENLKRLLGDKKVLD